MNAKNIARKNSSKKAKSNYFMLKCVGRVVRMYPEE